MFATPSLPRHPSAPLIEIVPSRPKKAATESGRPVFHASVYLVAIKCRWSEVMAMTALLPAGAYPIANVCNEWIADTCSAIMRLSDVWNPDYTAFGYASDVFRMGDD